MTDAYQWLVIIKRDDHNPEITPFADEHDARVFFDHWSQQWTESYLTRVVIGPGPHWSAARAEHGFKLQEGVLRWWEVVPESDNEPATPRSHTTAMTPERVTVTSAEFRADSRAAIREVMSGKTVTVTDARGEPRMHILRQTDAVGTLPREDELVEELQHAAMRFDDALDGWIAGLVSAGELAMAAVEAMAAGANVEATAARLPPQGRAALLEWVAGQPGRSDEVVTIGRGEPRWLHGRTRRRVRRYLVDRARERARARGVIEPPTNEELVKLIDEWEE